MPLLSVAAIFVGALFFAPDMTTATVVIVAFAAAGLVVAGAPPLTILKLHLPKKRRPEIVWPSPAARKDLGLAWSMLTACLAATNALFAALTVGLQLPSAPARSSLPANAAGTQSLTELRIPSLTVTPRRASSSAPLFRWLRGDKHSQCPFVRTFSIAALWHDD
jgi:hypothetical protein